MKIEKNKWVSIHYTLKDDDGNQLDSSVGKEPLGYLHGNGYLIFGLENELEGKNPGDKFTAVIQPKDGYGDYDPRLIVDVPRSQFETEMPIEVGMQFQAMTAQGPSIVKVIEVGDDKIKIDGNHELAGKVLHFDVEVVEVRDATEEELNPRGCGGGSCGGCGGGCGDCGGCGGDCGGCN
ncbi:MAG: peptidylprolyl isomerase [Treponema sp.]|nr:peptidylprolyl isomerase [Treponema sp.]